LSVGAPAFFFGQHSKLEQTINSIIFPIVNNALNFSTQPGIKNDKFYTPFPHEHQHKSYPFVTQHISPGQTYPPGLSVIIFCVSHIDRQVAQISHA
jgi:hypothetical protein